jgi:ABC-type uncharacterized transport system ATPase subunit
MISQLSAPTVQSVPLLQVSGLTRDFGSLRANDNVSFHLDAGEVLGIVGENGAGKSTLVKMLGGLLPPNSGAIYIGGVRTVLLTPQHATRAGIGVVHQHFTLVEPLTVEQNLVLAQPNLRRGILRYSLMRPRFQAIADDLGVTLDFNAPVASLSVGAQQQLELIKALFQQPRLLILDEPTAVLAPAERDNLMGIIGRLKKRGTATILISHKLEDLYACCDRAVVMRLGKVVGEVPVAREQQDKLVKMIVGKDLPVPNLQRSKPGAPVLTVSELNVTRPNGTTAVEGVSFELRSGEILGLCGVEGNGQSELLQSLAGMYLPDSGVIVYDLGPKRITGPCNAALLRRRGVAHIAEDRLRHAVVPEFPLTHNWLVRKLHERIYNRLGWINKNRVGVRTRQAIAANDVRVPKTDARVAQLSGGNQQKFVLARELDEEPAVILAGHPTRGLDLLTIANVRQRLLDARARGTAILLLSADLDEIWSLADRVMVMTKGRARGPVEIARTSVQEVGTWMTTP